jgi:hypothetical protein
MSEQQSTLPASKAELLEQIRQERAALEQWLAELTPAQMTMPGPEGWSVKDHLAHLVAWEQVLIGRYLQGKPFAEAAGIDETTWNSKGSMNVDEINLYFHARDKDLTLQEVLNRFQRSYPQVLDALASVDEVALFAPFDNGSEPLVAHVAGNTYEHYQEHTQWMRAFVG